MVSGGTAQIEATSGVNLPHSDFFGSISEHCGERSIQWVSIFGLRFPSISNKPKTLHNSNEVDHEDSDRVDFEVVHDNFTL